ncbi:Gamma-crystallin related domain-containing protein [Schistosoma japonicum]|nr:Gamma-crystallin related domain-containing protein [Schistosoma japonicum]
MSTVLVFFVILFPYSTIWSLEMSTNEIELNITSTEPQMQTKLLQGYTPPVECLRLFSRYNFHDYWSDMCDSNRLPSPFIMSYTREVCSHSVNEYSNRKYWIVYSYSNFRGRYILVPPGRCITSIRRYGIHRVGSIMKCILSSNNNVLYCNIPQHAFDAQNRISQNAVTGLQQSFSDTNSHSEYNLRDLERNSANVRDISR